MKSKAFHSLGEAEGGCERFSKSVDFDRYEINI